MSDLTETVKSDNDFKDMVIGPIVTRDIETQILTVEIKDVNGIRPDKRKSAVEFVVERLNIFFDEVTNLNL